MTHVAAQARVPKKGLLIFLGVAGLLLLLGVLSVLKGIVDERSRVDIVSVVDGNTVVVNAGGEQKTLVMAGVTAAPRNPDGLRVGTEFCLGEESYAWLRDRLPQGAVATVKTSRDGAPEGTESAVFTLAGSTVNVDMAEAGMAAPTGEGVGRGLREEIAQANETARKSANGRGSGLYDVEENCTLNHELYESSYALEHAPTSAEATVDAIDQRSVEYADTLDEVRLVRQDIAELDASRGTFTDLAWAPAKEDLQKKADAVVSEGLQVLRDLNAKRNELVAQG